MSTISELGSPITRRIAAAVLVIAGVIHLVLSPEYLAENRLIGTLFILSVPATVVPAVMLWRSGSRLGWFLGALVAGGMIVGFVLSRTVGLLGYVSGEWAVGIPAIVAELAFLLLGAYAASSSSSTGVSRRTAGVS